MKQKNKEKSLIIIRELIVTQTNHWSIFALAYGLSVMLSEAYSVDRLNLLAWGIMGIGLMANYLIRSRITRLPVSILLHFLVFIAMSLTGIAELEHLILHAAFAFFYCLLSVVKHFGGLEQEDESFSIPVIAILICVPFFFLTISKYENIINIYRNLLICLFTMFFMQHFFSRYARFVKLNEHSAGFFPKTEIMGAGLKSVIIYVGISAGLFFGIANMDSLTEFGDFIMNKLKQWIRDFFRSIFAGSDPEPKQSNPLDYNDFDSLTAKMGQGDVREQSVIGMIIEKLIWLLIILFALYCLYKLVKKILSLFSLRLDRPDIIVDDVVTDVRESCDTVSLKEKKVKEKRFFLNPRQKVRRSFKLLAKDKVFRICKSGDIKQLAFKTSGECSAAVKTPDISVMYDRARYSDEEITEQDAAAMKKICDELIKS
ncbi:MAG: hypothetical protein K6G24_10330 [Lachnospiraceae bacterium]|nr:hypothetical protein [Lachnospiraceae bacterium]